jgi:hypothetical protein
LKTQNLLNKNYFFYFFYLKNKNKKYLNKNIRVNKRVIKFITSITPKIDHKIGAYLENFSIKDN